MSKNRTVEIWATPNATVQEGYDFELKVNGCNATTLEFNKTTDKMKKKDNYQIEFILINKGPKAQNLRFSKTVSTVLWAKTVNNVADNCPKQACYMAGVFYVDPNEEIRDEKLTVINTDPSIQLFKFAFNFLRPGQIDGPNTDYALFDPIGSNQNGGVTFQNFNLVAFVLAGAGVGVAAFFAYRAWA